MAWGGEVFSSDIMWWLGDWTRLILHQLPLPRKSLKRGKRYFGLYLLMGGLNPSDMESDIETATALAKTMEVSNPALAKTFYTPLRQHSVLSGQSALSSCRIYSRPRIARRSYRRRSETTYRRSIFNLTMSETA